MRNLGYIKRYTKCDKGSVRATDARGKKGIFMEELALVMSWISSRHRMKKSEEILDSGNSGYTGLKMSTKQSILINDVSTFCFQKS